MKRLTPRNGALALMSLWAALWTFFVIGSELAQPDTPMVKAVAITLGCAFFLGSLLLAWRWKKAGIFLIVEGCLLAITNVTFFHVPWPSHLFLMVTLVAPPLLSGILLTEFWIESQAR